MIRKYPRTQHVHGSRLQPGDEDLDAVPFRALAGLTLVVEEKIDGANCGVSFDERGEMVLQSRGHALAGGARERHFDLFKQWASAHASRLRDHLGTTHVMYGEWVFAKHTIFYDGLPHYFLEFDVLDVAENAFLSTAARRTLLAGAPVVSVPVLHEGPLDACDALSALVTESRYKSRAWREHLAQAAREGESAEWGDVERAIAETDPSDLAEGLYIKHEQDGRVVGRYKWIRHDFLQAVARSQSHWLSRPIVKNRLAPDVDLFAP